MAMTLSGSNGITFNDASTQSTGKQACKAWVNFNPSSGSSAVIRASYNVSSVTYVGTGQYTVNYTTAMSNTNYSFQGTTSAISVGNNASYVSVPENGTISTSATSAIVVNDAGTARNPVYVFISVFSS